jgi:hypothetical protein
MFLPAQSDKVFPGDRYFLDEKKASIMASATPDASVRGQSIATGGKRHLRTQVFILGGRYGNRGRKKWLHYLFGENLSIYSKDNDKNEPSFF